MKDGEGGIRTHVTGKGKHAFQACAFDHSATSPSEQAFYLRYLPARRNPFLYKISAQILIDILSVLSSRAGWHLEKYLKETG